MTETPGSHLTVHVPILVEPIATALTEPLRALPPGSPPAWIVDCTLGGGGHTYAILTELSADPRLSGHRVLALDRDPGALERARTRFARELDEGRLELRHGRFSEADAGFEGRNVLGLMADLGFSSDQLADPERGLSFQSDGPLDMRLNPKEGWSARERLQQITERELEKVLRELGEERFAGRIAGAIVRRRREGTLPRTTAELGELVVRAVPASARHGRIHAATRTFQALRILVNDELKELDSLLERVILKISSGGRIAILSFHSLEDRKVKQAFRDGEFLKAITRKPIEAGESEVSRNPRSRSAKLRIAERL